MTFRWGVYPPPQLPDDFLQARDWHRYTADKLLVRLLAARANLGNEREGDEAAAAIEALFHAYERADRDPVRTVAVIRRIADRSTKDDPAAINEALILLEQRFPTAEWTRETVVKAMWPPWGDTRAARARLAWALGWTGTADSLHVMLNNAK